MSTRKVFFIICIVVLLSMALAACGTANPMKCVALQDMARSTV